MKRGTLNISTVVIVVLLTMRHVSYLEYYLTRIFTSRYSDVRYIRPKPNLVVWITRN